MSVYTCKTTKRLFIQFNYKGHTYKRRLPKEATKEDGERLETKLKHQLFFDSNGLEGKPDLVWEDFIQEMYLEYVQNNQPKEALDRALVVMRESMPFLRGKTVRQIKPDDLEKFKAHRAATPTRHGKIRKPATLHREFKILSAAFSMAVRNDLCDSNPCSKVKLPKFDNTQDKVLHIDDVERFLMAFRNSLQRDIALTVILSGLRQNDVLGLKKENLDLRENKIKVLQGKTKRKVAVPIHELIRPMLEQRAEKYDDLLFPSYRKPGQKMHSIKHGIKLACIRAKIPVLTIRDLRRTFGTLLHENGWDDKTVADLLGHSDTRSVHRYKRGSVIKERAISSLAFGVKLSDTSASDSEPPLTAETIALAKLLQSLHGNEVEMRRVELLASALRTQTPAPVIHEVTDIYS